MSFSRQQYAKVAPTLPTGDPIASYATYAQAQQAIAYLADQHFAVESLTIVGTNLTSVERVTGRLSYGRVAIAGAMSGAWFGLFVGLLLTMFGGAGAASGVWLSSIAIGAGFGLLFSVLSYAMTRSRRDFTSSSQIVASQYAVLCAGEHATEARRLLIASPVGLGQGGFGVVAQPMPSQPAFPVAPTALPPVPPPAPSADLKPYFGPTVTGSGATNPSGQPVSTATGLPSLSPAPSVLPNAPVAAPPKVDPRWVDADGKPKFGALAADHPGVELPNQTAPSPAPAPVATPPVAIGVVPPVEPSVGDQPQRNQGSKKKKDPWENDPFAPPPRK